MPELLDRLKTALADRYAIEREIGAGGMATVYLAEDLKLHRQVAIKVLRPELAVSLGADRFLQEIEVTAKLQHPQILPLYEAGEADEFLYYVMPYVEGETLRDQLTREGRLSLDDALKITDDVTAALGYAHERGIVHRDIKPENILLTSGRAVVGDFGIARAVEVAGGERLTGTGIAVGTPAYMSPEQATGAAEVDQRSDVYSLGCVLFEMLAGRAPFEGATAQAVLAKHAVNTVPDLHASDPSVPLYVKRAVEKALAKQPAERFPSARELLDVLTSGTVVRPVWSSLTAHRSRLRATIIAFFGVSITLVVTWLVAGRASPVRHLAVLPFTIFGATPDDSALSAGLVESLTSALSRVEPFEATLSVLPAGEIVGAITPSQAREQFGVGLVVTGVMQIEGERIRLTLNLVDTESQRQLGSDQFDYGGSSTLALQDEAVSVLSSMLQLTIASDAQQAISVGTTSSDLAHELYLRALGYLAGAGSDNEVERAINLLKAAIAEDSLFALGHAYLGSAYWTKFGRSRDTRWAEEAIEQAKRAISLDDRLAAARITMGRVYSGTGRSDEAIAELTHAIDLEPSNSEAHRFLGVAYRGKGMFAEAEGAYKRSIKLKPKYWRGHSSLGALYYVNGQYEDAIEQFSEGLALAPGNLTLLNSVGAAYWELERLGEATDMFERVLEVDPGRTMTKSNLATAYYYLGRFAEAASLYEEVLFVNPADDSRHAFLGMTYAQLPDARAKAEQSIRQAIDLAWKQREIMPQDLNLIASLASYYALIDVRDTALMFVQQVEDLIQPDSADTHFAFGFGETLLALGGRDEALPWLLSALRRGYGWIQVRYSPTLKGLASDPEFQEMLRTLRDD